MMSGVEERGSAPGHWFSPSLCSINLTRRGCPQTRPRACACGAEPCGGAPPAVARICKAKGEEFLMALCLLVSDRPFRRLGEVAVQLLMSVLGNRQRAGPARLHIDLPHIIAAKPDQQQRPQRL